MKLEQNLLTDIEQVTSRDELLNASKYINLNYNIFSSDRLLWDEIKRAFGDKCSAIISFYEDKIIANKFINELLFKYYPSERIIKYALVHYLKNKHDTVLFEMPVLDSRIDICRINGKSYAYEIKTEFDTVKRLKKQINDYSRVFEYVYVIIPESFYNSVLDIIPAYCGIRIIKHNSISGDINFLPKRKAMKSPNIDSYSQLSSFSKESLGIWMSDKHIKKIPSSKEDRIHFIIEKYSAKTINNAFKQIVKKTYRDNWSFILEHYNEILPLDIQTFFNNALDPKLIYYKNVD